MGGVKNSIPETDEEDDFDEDETDEDEEETDPDAA
jgi:hypothetical protein